MRYAWFTGSSPERVGPLHATHNVSLALIHPTAIEPPRTTRVRFVRDDVLCTTRGAAYDGPVPRIPTYCSVFKPRYSSPSSVALHIWLAIRLAAIRAVIFRARCFGACFAVSPDWLDRSTTMVQRKRRGGGAEGGWPTHPALM